MNGTYFYKNKSNSIDGFNPSCIECTCKKSRKYRDDNLDNVKAYEKKKYQNKKNYYKENNRRYYAEKGEKKRALTRLWQKTDHGKKKYKGYRKNREHKKHNISDSEWELCKSFFGNACAYCAMSYDEHKIKHNEDLHKDHLCHEGRNDIKNCVPSCRSCNPSKRTYTLNEWYSSSNINYTYERYHRIYLWIRYEAKKASSVSK